MASGPRRVAPAATAAPPVTVIVGEEELLVERAVSAAVALASGVSHTQAGNGADASDAAEPFAADVTGGIDVHHVAAFGLTAGELSNLTAPSLFGGGCVVVIGSAQDATKDLSAALTRLAKSPAPDVFLVITHAGGAKNKALLADLVSAGARRVDCPSVKRFGERMDFLRGELRQAGRKADEAGLRALLDAVGNDLRDLAAACSQLAADTTGVINTAAVARYYHGRAEATGFSVADKACEGNLAEALVQLRWALATGTSPVLITSALATGLRTLGLVGSVGRGLSPNALAADLGMPPWKIDQARRQLRGWTAAGLARAHAAVAEADVQVKGEGASAGYALERAITTIVACRTQ
ncbi:MAG TPA: DNA polymerase III subunit delta [Streptosporangiaceae bacterium]|nr:DNA polymerase III subunit delta [Streptosporangiaceae bacterium]